MERDFDLPTNPDYDFKKPMEPLLPSRSHANSISGESDILLEVLKRYGIKNKWCVEFGARDGIAASNTYSLIEDMGWNAILIESNHVEAHHLRKNTAHNAKVETLELLVTATGKNSLDSIFKNRQIPKDFDLLVIDIDSYDYQIWESLTNYKPRVVMIEYNEALPTSMTWVQKETGPFTGSSVKTLEELGTSKGYSLVYAQDANAIFVDNSEIEKSGISPNPLDWSKASGTIRVGTFIQAYDGTFILIPEKDSKPIQNLSSTHTYATSQVFLLSTESNKVEAINSNKENTYSRKIKEAIKNSWLGIMLYPLALKFYSFLYSEE